MAKKTKNKNGNSNSTTDWWNNTQTALTVAGMTPAWGIFADAGNTLISGTRTAYNKIIGDQDAYKEHAIRTGINASTMIPVVGQGVAMGKLATLSALGANVGGKKLFSTWMKEVGKNKVKNEVIKKGTTEVVKKGSTKVAKVKEVVKKGADKIKTATGNAANSTKENIIKTFWSNPTVKKATIGTGVAGIVKAGYDDYVTRRTQNDKQDYIEANPNVDETGARSYEAGGVAAEQSMEAVQESVNSGQTVELPGGSASPIVEGETAIEYSGQTHEENNGSNSGIVVDNAEVENGETQDQIAMKGGVKKDYFFSQHLKKGGIPIAEWHKNIVKNGNSQEAKNSLAREQELIAGRDPDVIAKKGGFRKFSTGGDAEFGMNLAQGLNSVQDNTAFEDFNPNYKQAASTSKGGKGYGNAGDYTTDTDGDGTPDFQDSDLDGDGVPNAVDTDPNIASKEEKKEAKTESPNPASKTRSRFNAYGENYGKVEEASTAAGYTGGGAEGSYRADDLGEEGIAGTQKGAGKGYYGEVNQGNLEDFYNRNKSLMKEMGINSADEFDPEKHTKQFQEKFNDNLSKTYENDKELQTQLESQGISKEDYLKQSGFSGKGATGVDGKMGEYTWSKTSMSKKAAPETTEGDTPPPEEGGGEYVSSTETTETSGGFEKKRRWGDNVDLSALQFLPAAVAMTDKPDYMDAPDHIVPPTVRAERIKAEKMDMQNFNAERAASDMDAASFDRFVETSGGGASNYANKMANQTSKFRKRMAINAAETKANVDIQGQNVANKLNADATNQGKALEASTTNASHQAAAAETNTKNKMYVNEFNKGADAATFDRKLQALDTMTQGVMTMQMARDKNKTDLAIANATDGNRDAFERWQLGEGDRFKSYLAEGNWNKKTT